tara:strand:- start:63 stop:578 length:516 start_codon:yes stop_codon:yes gene_type:complete
MLYNQPLLAPEFLDWVKNQNFNDSIILELGSGASTFFFSKFFKQVISYESKENYYNSILADIKFNNITNIDLYIQTPNLFSDLSFIDHIKLADVILIDNLGIPRINMAQIVNEFKKENSIIVLDNGTRNMYAYQFLKDNYYSIDFLREDEEGLTETSVFFKKMNSKDRVFR